MQADFRTQGPLTRERKAGCPMKEVQPLSVLHAVHNLDSSSSGGGVPTAPRLMEGYTAEVGACLCKLVAAARSET